MTATGHAVIGALLAAKIANPYIGIPLAIISHLAADAFPHWDLGTNEKQKGRTRVRNEAVFDVIISLLVGYGIIFLFFPDTNLVYVFVMIIAAQLFDWLTAPYYFFHMEFPPFSWIFSIAKRFDNRLDKPWGIINQVTVLIALTILAKVV